LRDAIRDPEAAALLAHPTRRALFDLIQQQWGLCETELGRLTGLGRDNVKYHLQRLVRGRLVAAHPEGRKVHFFPRGAGPATVHRAVSSIQGDTRRRILGMLVRQPDLSWRAVSREVGITPRAVRWHLRQLADMDLLTVESEGGLRRTVLASSLLEALGDLPREAEESVVAGEATSATNGSTTELGLRVLL
jgi:predicted transcriptional regulator